jgi:hypothetical protein
MTIKSTNTQTLLTPLSPSHFKPYCQFITNQTINKIIELNPTQDPESYAKIILHLYLNTLPTNSNYDINYKKHIQQITITINQAKEKQDLKILLHNYLL